MARGFAAGLVQGALVCGAALAALSLALPQPPRAPTQIAALPDVAAPAASIEAAPAAPQPAQAPTPETPAAPEVPAASETPAPETPAPAPQVAAIPEPAAPEPVADTPLADAPVIDTPTPPENSEFARAADDLQPVAPQPLSETPMVAAAPAIDLPGDEAAPAPADPTAQPLVRADAPAAPVMTPPAPESLELPQAAAETPMPVAPPGRVLTPGLDAPPQQLAQAPLAAATPLLVQDADRLIRPAVAALPAAQGAGFDLSTPPDLSTLTESPQ